jgi:hypothetical protein
MIMKHDKRLILGLLYPIKYPKIFYIDLMFILKRNFTLAGHDFLAYASIK